jgi:hypothetical protein
MLREKIKSRPALFSMATVGLLLMHLSNFISLSIRQRNACVVIGTLLFIAALLNLVPLLNQESKSSAPDSNKAAAFSCIAFGALLLTGRFLHTSLWLHGLIDMIAGGLFFFCWSLPRSRWTELIVVPVLVIALLQIRWKVFSTFASIRPTALVVILAVWVLFSLITFRIIDKRKPKPAVELH